MESTRAVEPRPTSVYIISDSAWPAGGRAGAATGGAAQG